MRNKFTTAIAILLLISVGLACSLLRPKSQLTWHLVLEIDAAEPDRAEAVDKTTTVIVRRLDDLGVHPTIRNLDNGRIWVSLPNVPDRERLKKLITAGGLLELTAVVSPPSPSPVQTYSSREDALASLVGVPPNRRVLPYAERSESTADEQGGQPERWVVVESPSIVDGSELRNASAVQSPAGTEEYQIAFSLGPEGAEKFAAWTGAHVNDYLGVVFNGEVKSIAYIRGQIADQGEISGGFTKQSAEDLALSLQSGALPAPVKIIEEGNNK